MDAKITLTFRQKIIVLTISLVVITQIATLSSVSSIATRNIEQSAHASLALGGRIFRDFMDNRSAQLAMTLPALVADFGFKEAVATNDAATISSALDNHRRRAGAEIALLVNLDGRVAVVAGMKPQGVQALELPELISPVGGAQIARSVAHIEDRYFQTFATAVRAPVPVAWVVFGYRVDATLATRVQVLSGLQVTFVDTSEDNPGVIASTLPAKVTRVLDNRLYDAAAAASMFGAAGRKIGPDKEQYLSAWSPLQDGERHIASVLHVSMTDAYLPFYRARNTAAIFAGAAMLLAVLGAGWLANAVSSPLRRLAGATSRFAAGDYETPVQLHSRDEIGALADSFNSMRLAVAERERAIRYSADYDLLTGLPNRPRLITTIRDMAQHSGPGHSFAVVKFEITQFTQLTATLGYGVGEGLVRLVANRLSGLLTDEQPLARVEGAEFVAVLPGAAVDDVRRFVDQVQAVLATGMRLHDATINLSCIAGVALFPDHGQSAEDLLRRASIAKADARGHDATVFVYRSGREDGHVRQLRIIGDLRTALKEDQLSLVYQPKLKIADGRVHSVEALVRWQHPDLGALPPDEFIGLAEQFGLINSLTRWVIRESIRQSRAWRDQGLCLDVAVNLSARDLMDDDLPVYISDALRSYRIDPGQLTIEVTESAVMRDLEKCISVLKCLREIGVRIAIDDFGTGHSSLLQLKHMPLDELKIDRSFVAGLLEDERDGVIVQTTLELAHRMQLEVVAEGIESDDVLERLTLLGCEYAQGYGISRPLTPGALAAWKRDRDGGVPRLVSV